MKLLIVFGTTEGHTAHICDELRKVAEQEGVAVVVANAAGECPDPAGFDVCFVAASLHIGDYQPCVVEFARRYHDVLNRQPSVFFSVSLSAAGENPDDWEGLEQCVRRFREATDWEPGVVHHVAGAIRYSRYDFFKGLALKFIAPRRGQKTSTNRDYDLTDYDELSGFVAAFLRNHRVEA